MSGSAILDPAVSQAAPGLIRRGAQNFILTQSVGEAECYLLQSFNQHIVVERPMKFWLFGHCLPCTIVQGDCGSVSVHR